MSKPLEMLHELKDFHPEIHLNPRQDRDMGESSNNGLAAMSEKTEAKTEVYEVQSGKKIPSSHGVWEELQRKNDYPTYLTA